MRSALKTLSWRFLATGTTFTLVLIMTGETMTALSVGSLEAVAKMILYFAHERAWANIPVGLNRPQAGDSLIPEISESIQTRRD